MDRYINIYPFTLHYSYKVLVNHASVYNFITSDVMKNLYKSMDKLPIFKISVIVLIHRTKNRITP